MQILQSIIVLGKSYMYEMKIVASFLFRVIMFPHDEKIVVIDELTYYEKKTLTSLDGVLPSIISSPELITNYIEFKPGQFKPSMPLGTYPADPPMLEGNPPATGAPMCMVSLSNTINIRN